MKQRAFTLIEVMVVMAIISILAGMLVPSVWKFWESEEIATTRQRIREIKTAMIGNSNLFQDGRRSDYGFVGVYGDLPFSNPSSCVIRALGNVSTLPGHYDASHWRSFIRSSDGLDSFYLDAWGKNILCENKLIIGGRLVGLTVVSYAPSGEKIEETITEDDVTPTQKIIGNNPTTNEGLKLSIEPDYGGSFPKIETLCLPIRSFSNYTTQLLYKLPIGRISITMKGYDTSSCDNPLRENSFILNINDRSRVIQLPDLRL
ncbi:MAG: type II secretion system protein [Desulfuromonadales bacterium]